MADFISPELLIAWGRATPHFNQKIQVMGSSYTEVQHFENQKLLKIVWPIRRGNTYIFIIYYQGINQKDKLLYIDTEKNSIFQFIYWKKFKTTAV